MEANLICTSLVVMEFEGHGLSSGVGERPSYFECIAHQTLHDTLRPSVQYLVNVER